MWRVHLFLFLGINLKYILIAGCFARKLKLIVVSGTNLLKFSITIFEVVSNLHFTYFSKNNTYYNNYIHSEISNNPIKGTQSASSEVIGKLIIIVEPGSRGFFVLKNSS